MVCQGFVYDEFNGVASFLGQDKTQLIYLSKQPQTCNRPGSSLWLLNAGMQNRTLVFSCCHSAEFSVAHSSRIPQGSRLSMPILTNLPQMTLLQHVHSAESSCESGVLHIWCFAAIPQAGASLSDPRQTPTPAGHKGSNAASDAGTPTCHAVSQGTMCHKHVHLSIPKLHSISDAMLATLIVTALACMHSLT